MKGFTILKASLQCKKAKGTYPSYFVSKVLAGVVVSYFA